MGLKEKLDSINVSVHPRCATCGCQDHFEHNDDMTYIKCTNCGREYFGGRDELLEYNQDEIEAAKQELSKQAAPIIKEELLKAFKKR